MSIINDALRKAQESLEKKGKKHPYDIAKPTNAPTETDNHANADNTPNIPSAQPPTNSIQSNTKNLIIAITIALVFIIIFAIVLILILKGAIPRITTTPQIQSQQQEIETSDEEKKAQKTASMEKALKLEGTMMMKETRGALINGEVYMPGETINGLKVKTINLKNVELEDSSGNIVTIGVIK